MTTHLVLQMVAAFALLMAGILQFAVFKAPDTGHDVRAKRSARKVMAMAMVCAGCYLLYLTARNMLADAPLTLFLGLAAMAQIIFAYIKLFPEGYRHEQW